jgi:hypothetical protein
MDASQKQLIVDRRFHSSYDNRLAGKVKSAITKLMKDSALPGLHVEPMQGAKDSRIRTARIDSNHRMIFFDLGPSYLLHGVYSHDRSDRLVKTLFARVNPRSGALEIRDGGSPSPSHQDQGRFITDAEIKALREDAAAKAVAEHQEAEQKAAEEKSRILLERFDATQLVDELGIDQELAELAVNTSETTLLDRLEGFPSWQSSAILDLATGTSLAKVKENYVRSDAEIGGTDADQPSDLDDIIKAVEAPQAASQFHLIRDDQALKEALEGGDFDAWRLFLHPDQKEHVEKETSGPYRLTGGAGTGKTVVLVHRAVRLARKNPKARVLVVSFTKNLTKMIEQQIHELDPGVVVTPEPGKPGICVITMDGLASHVIRTAAKDVYGRELPNAMQEVLGWSVSARPGYRSMGNGADSPWAQAIDVAGDDLPDQVRTPYFFQSEYSQIILPLGVTDLRGYIRAPRTGRGTRLGRAQRKAVWDVVDQYRRDGAIDKDIDWPEAAAVAARVYRPAEGSSADQKTLADHLLIDEAQDLSPTHWMLARNIVAEGPDDIFIAEDANQRIYGNRIVLSHYGVQVRGRSRRLRLNYRTTEQNLQWALKVLDGGDYDVDEAEGANGGTSAHNDDRYLSSRIGPEPNRLTAGQLTEEYNRVADLLKEWVTEMRSEELDLSTLGILVRTKIHRSNFVRAMGDRGVDVTPVDQDPVPKGTPVVMTFHRAKGTEFSRVLLFDVSEDSIPKAYPGTGYDEKARADNELRERSLLYVGATRARDHLAVSWSKKASPFLPSVEG